MFGRLLWRLLWGNRGRLAVALVSVASGAAVISALLNLDFDLERKLTHEFSVLGPNLVISQKAGAQVQNAGATSPSLMDQTVVESAIAETRAQQRIDRAPYLYIVARVAGRPVVVAGTNLDTEGELNPTWKRDVGPPTIDERVLLPGVSSPLVGRNVARQLKLVPGSSFQLQYLDRRAMLVVDAILDSGGAEDNQILVDLRVAQQLAGTPGQIEAEQLRVPGNARAIAEYAARLAAALPGYDVRPIRQVTEAEGNLLNRTRLLIVSMVLLILVLTALCVLATMAALAMERRMDVGLMKALGGPISRILALFLAEVSALGAAGGLVGCLGGMVLAHWLGQRVFGTPITARWEILPLTMALMIGMALAAAFPLRLLGRVKPAVILRGD